jgi:glycosyltransferase involved in cell wall biosynthesis
MTVTAPLYSSLSSRNIKNVKIISNGADCKIFKPCENKDQMRITLGLNKDDFILVFSGGIGGYYRVDLIIRAIKKVNPKIPNIKLLIVGPGSSENIKKINISSKEMGISNNVIFLGAKTDKTELASLLGCSDIGMVPYDSNPLWNNALPAKSFEYFACGLPIIATTYKDSVLGKLIEDNDIGIISEPNDVDGLANAIEKIYYSNIESSSKRAISLIRKYYDRNKIAKDFLRLLEIVTKS